MCHVIRVYTFCPGGVCRDPGGKGEGGEVGDVRLRWHVWSLSLGDKWAMVTLPSHRRPQTSPDVPRPQAARVADRPERRRVTAWLITTRGGACSSAPPGPLQNNWPLRGKTPCPPTPFTPLWKNSTTTVSNRRICQLLCRITCSDQREPIRDLDLPHMDPVTHSLKKTSPHADILNVALLIRVKVLFFFFFYYIPFVF